MVELSFIVLPHIWNIIPISSYFIIVISFYFFLFFDFNSVFIIGSFLYRIREVLGFTILNTMRALFPDCSIIFIVDSMARISKKKNQLLMELQ